MTSSLITKLEEAREGSRELDALVWLALNETGEIDEKETGRTGAMAWRCRLPGSVKSSWTKPEPVTTSLDATLALAERVLPGWRLTHLGEDTHPGNPHRWAASFEDRNQSDWAVYTEETGHTPPLALCIAILTAQHKETTT